MSNTNTSTKSTIGVVENLCLDFGTGGVYLQVQVVPHAKFGLLLRHSFHYHLVLPLRTFQMICRPSCFEIPTQESHINCPPKLGPKAVCSASADYFVQITNELLKWVFRNWWSTKRLERAPFKKYILLCFLLFFTATSAPDLSHSILSPFYTFLSFAQLILSPSHLSTLDATYTFNPVDFFLGNKQRTLTRMLSRQLLLPSQIEHYKLGK